VPKDNQKDLFIDDPLQQPLINSLLRFEKKPDQHYCGNVLLRIASRLPRPPKSKEGAPFNKHNFYARKPEKGGPENNEILNYGIRVKSIDAGETPQSRI